ncbi:hypothetical protein N7494_000577 [Penicillium frequentans]|uniref:DUF7703 domain-containing protein n=1 Tax=Penicillium frequentans TaxID=3151616 RepID=A0AAD6D8H6_9EURO|nr:hypothetical protein N7494_000577 [Penicillium glabrum]
MDTFMTNLSPEVGIILQENISNIIVISMLATAMYNVMETVIITFDIVKNYRALYFWSMQASCCGILMHAVSAIICCTFQQSTLPTSILFIVGWYAMVTGQAVVCYSRLRLVVLDTSKVRWVLWMIVVNACILHVPMTVLFFGRISSDPHFPRPASIFNRIQLVGFCVQESVIYSIKLRLEFVLLYHLRTPMHADALGLAPGRRQGQSSSSDVNILNTITAPTTVALEVIRPSRGEAEGGQDPCHSQSSSTAEYHEALCDISHHPAEI